MPIKIVNRNVCSMAADSIVHIIESGNRFRWDEQLVSLAGIDYKLDLQHFLMQSSKTLFVSGNFDLNCQHIIHYMLTDYSADGIAECYFQTIKTSFSLYSKSIAIPFLTPSDCGLLKEEIFSILYDVVSTIHQECNSVDFYICVGEGKTFDGRFLESFSTALQENYRTEPSLLSFPVVSTIKDIQLEEKFSDMLIHLINKKGLKPSKVYKKAGVLKQTYSNIISNKSNPSKITAIAFAIALELDLNQTSELLSKAGFILSKSSLEDMIILHFIQNHIYDKYEINNALSEFNLELLPVN